MTYDELRLKLVIMGWHYNSTTTDAHIVCHAWNNKNIRLYVHNNGESSMYILKDTLTYLSFKTTQELNDWLIGEKKNGSATLIR